MTGYERTVLVIWPAEFDLDKTFDKDIEEAITTLAGSISARPSRQDRKLVDLLLEQDVFFVHVGVDEAELGLVGTVTERRTRNLDHGRNASSASNHAEVAREASTVVELALGSLDAYMVANLEQGDVARDVALLVRL